MKTNKTFKGKALSLLLVTFLMGLLLVGCGSSNQGETAVPSASQSPEVSAEASEEPSNEVDKAFNVTITDSTGTEIIQMNKAYKVSVRT